MTGRNQTCDFQKICFDKSSGGSIPTRKLRNELKVIKPEKFIRRERESKRAQMVKLRGTERKWKSSKIILNYATLEIREKSLNRKRKC